MLWDHFHADMARAHRRVESVPSEIVETPHGVVEYATEGNGDPVLVSHGIWGSHVEGLGLGRTYLGEGFRAVSPSRFGYFRSDLSADASPALQADVYVSLLDHLGIERTIAVGFSAGGPSVIQLALRHPDRVSTLLLMSSALARSSIATTASAIISAARGPIMWTPSISSVLSSAMTFTNPSVSMLARALPLALKGKFPTLYFFPCSFNCSSVNPTAATSGQV